jgi:hypothetical protein
MRWFVMALLVSSAHCGGDYVLLHITSSHLSAPAQTDMLALATYADDETTPRFTRTIILTHDFPEDVLLDLNDDVPHALRHFVEALLGDDVVARVSASHSWKDNERERVTIPLDSD